MKRVSHHDMDLIEINNTIGLLTADLSLYKCNMGDISLTVLKELSGVLRENRMDFEREVQNALKDKATEFFMGELYYSLTGYSRWYSENYTYEAGEEIKEETRTVFEQIEVMWRPVIEELFPKFIDPELAKGHRTENDPGGFNSTFGKAGEKYRSIRYDITENPAYSHLTKDVIFDRLQKIVSEIPNEGADISRLLSLAYKYGLLTRIPTRKSVQRELGMKSSEQSLTELIMNREDAISNSKRLDSMKEKLLGE